MLTRCSPTDVVEPRETRYNVASTRYNVVSTGQILVILYLVVITMVH